MKSVETKSSLTSNNLETAYLVPAKASLYSSLVSELSSSIDDQSYQFSANLSIPSFIFIMDLAATFAVSTPSSNASSAPSALSVTSLRLLAKSLSLSGSKSSKSAA